MRAIVLAAVAALAVASVASACVEPPGPYTMGPDDHLPIRCYAAKGQVVPLSCCNPSNGDTCISKNKVCFKSAAPRPPTGPPLRHAN